MDRIWRSDVLQEAWKRVRRNRGAAGVDSQSLGDVEQYGVERFLEELGAELRAGKYRSRVVRRRYIPKTDDCSGQAWRQLIADGLLQASAGTC